MKYTFNVMVRKTNFDYKTMCDNFDKTSEYPFLKD